MKKQPIDRVLRIPFGLAAEAAGIPQTRFRNWLLRHVVHLDADQWRGDAAHRRLSRLDVARLGLVARLGVAGLTIDAASKVAEYVLQRIASPLEYRAIDHAAMVLNKTPEPEILDRLRGATLTLFVTSKNRPAIVISTRDKPAKEPPQGSAVRISIDIGAMMREQDERLKAAESRQIDIATMLRQQAEDESEG
jgi:hypothetical protein